MTTRPLFRPDLPDTATTPGVKQDFIPFQWVPGFAKSRQEQCLANLQKAIAKLSGRERMIIELRFGLNTVGGEEKTQKEVADMLGISQSYISRLEKKIISKLKKTIEKNMK